MMNVTVYKGLTKYYFRYLIHSIIRIGDLDRKDYSILDFGSGFGELKRVLSNGRVINFDVIKTLSDVDDWKKVNFDVLVANEVFFLFTEKMLHNFMQDLKSKKHDVILIVGISNQGILNKIGMFLTNKKNSLKGTKLLPHDEIKILKSYCNIIKTKNVFFLAKVFLLRFKM